MQSKVLKEMADKIARHLEKDKQLMSRTIKEYCLKNLPKRQNIRQKIRLEICFLSQYGMVNNPILARVTESHIIVYSEPMGMEFQITYDNLTHSELVMVLTTLHEEA